MAGKAVLQVTNGDVGVPEELLEEVKAVPGVKVAAPSVQGYLSTEGLGGERPYVLGIDLLADQELRDYQSGATEAVVEDALVFLAQPDSIALTTTLLERRGLAAGDRVRVLTSSGPTDLTVRATLDVQTGPASVFGGALAVMDVFAAQRLFQLDRRFTQIDVGAADGASVEDLQVRLSSLVGGRGVVERPVTRGETFDSLIAGTQVTFTITAALATIVAVYLIFNTMTIAVAERRRELGCLRALGMRRAEVVRLVLAESALLGVVGSLLGIGLGLVLARGLSVSFSTNVSQRFFPIDPPWIVLDPRAAALGLGVGFAAALVAASLPALEAVRVQPLEAMRAEAPRAPAHGFAGWAVAGAALMAASLAAFLVRRLLPFDLVAVNTVSQNAFMISVSMVSPAAVRSIAAHGEGTLGRLFGPLGAFVSRSLVAGIVRIAITSAALIIALANATVLASLISTLERTMQIMQEAEFGHLDLGISGGQSLTPGDSRPLPVSVVDEIGSLPGVAAVDAERWVKVPFEGSLTYLIARNSDTYARGLRDFVAVEGDLPAAIARLRQGTAVIVTDVFAHRFSKKLGDSVALKAPGGEIRLPIAAIVLNMLDLGAINIDRSLYQRVWRDDTVTFIDPVLEKGIDAEALMATIRGRFGDRYGLSVVTFAQIREWNDKLLAQSVAVAYPLIAIALVIALLGVVNSLLASVLDRVREIGLLRAVGATRRQIVRAVVLESALVGFAGGILGLAAGSLLGYMATMTLLPDVFGFTAFYRYPAAAAVFTLVLAILLAALAGYVPGRVAGRLRITEALKYE
jgi:putative ABC transport system permease protein